MQQAIQINHCYTASNSILVNYSNELEEKEKKINRESFTTWLYSTGRFVVDYFSQVGVNTFHNDVLAYLKQKHSKEIFPDYSTLLDIDNDELN